MVCGARDVVAGASRVPLGDASSDTLERVIAAAGRLCSAAEALLLNATAALEAFRAGAGRTALRDQARLSSRNAKRTVEASEQVAQMPNVARGLALGELTKEHAEVLADTARRTSPEAVDNAVELLEAAGEVSPEVLRRDAREFAARHDPDGARTVLDRQRRDRSAAMFIDESTGMGVLNARFDPVSYALVLQAVENYNDALWRQDGGRDGTPDQIRDNRQRRADSVFEMLTNRNALATIGHPAASAGKPARPSPSEDSHGRNNEPAPGHSGDASHPGQGNANHGPPDDASHPGQGNAKHNQPSDASHPGQGNVEHGRHSDVERDLVGGAGPRGDSDVVPWDAAGRSVERWRPSQAPNQLIIIADIGVIDGTKPDGLCEMLGGGPIPPETLDNLSPDTRISGAVFAGPGQVLWLGRSCRHASIAQQLAVAIRDRGCVLCRAPMHRCEFHHIAEWAADNGTTDTPNLAALCDDCHNTLHNNKQRLVHHPATGRWTTKPHTADTTATTDGGTDASGRCATKPLTADTTATTGGGTDASGRCATKPLTADTTATTGGGTDASGRCATKPLTADTTATTGGGGSSNTAAGGTRAGTTDATTRDADNTDLIDTSDATTAAPH